MNNKQIEKSMHTNIREILVPSHLAGGGAEITIQGHKYICIEDYKTLLQCSAEVISVCTYNDMKITITGRNLVIREISLEKMHISGTFTSIFFDEG